MSLHPAVRFFTSFTLFAAAAGLASATGCGEDPAPDDTYQADAAPVGAAPGGGAGQQGIMDAGAGAPDSAAGGNGGRNDAASGGGSSGGGSSGGGGSDAATPTDAASGGGNAGGGNTGGGTQERFSFFMTSQAGLGRLAKNPNGFGGDLRFGKPDGLSGADEICKQLAESSMPGNGKTWRAFLSVTKGPNGMAVNAIDRVGEGPWYDRRGRLFAMNKAALMSTRPLGADPVIIDDFPNEDGVPNHNPGTGIVDNHNALTGSSNRGAVDARGLPATCQDWTSSAADGGMPRCGVSWPRAQLTHWISVLNEGGCAPGATPPGAEAGMRGTVGALGGYGGFYCFALTP
jgi:hypothetical protein